MKSGSETYVLRDPPGICYSDHRRIRKNTPPSSPPSAHMARAAAGRLSPLLLVIMMLRMRSRGAVIVRLNTPASAPAASLPVVCFLGVIAILHSHTFSCAFVCKNSRKEQHSSPALPLLLRCLYVSCVSGKGLFAVGTGKCSCR